MELVLPFLVALALSMDVFAVSTACGIQHQKNKASEIFPIALIFSCFHVATFFIGYALVGPFAQGFVAIGHFISFALLFGIGIKMILSSRKPEFCFVSNLDNVKTIFVLALATSIDAFGIGVSFGLVDKPMSLFLILLFICVFIVTFVGFKAGNLLSNAVGKKPEFVGGVILCLIGIKILIEYYS